MELYDALKKGTSVEELRAAFEKDLKEASTRLEEEKSKEDELKKAREALMNAIAAYVPLYTKKPDNEYDINHLVHSLEDTMDASFGLKKNWYQVKTAASMNDLIDQFLKTL